MPNLFSKTLWFKVFLIPILIFSLLFPFISEVATKVKGHYRKNGTYTKSYYRSNKDGKKLNNWSTKGNINPFTGKKGTKKIK